MARHNHLRPNKGLIPTTLALTLLLLFNLSQQYHHPNLFASAQQPTCSATEAELTNTNDPSLQTMKFDVGYGPQEFRAYVQPDVSEFYREPKGTRKLTTPHHNGWAAKFVNMGNKHVTLWWDAGANRPGSLIAYMAPFQMSGTASFPSHKFYLTPHGDDKTILARFVVSPPQAVHFYDPITIPGDEEATQRNLDTLSSDEFELYQEHLANRDFGKKYFEFTGREYLSFFPRSPPSHKMWRADYFGQEHWVTTREVHFLEMPQDSELEKVKDGGSKRVLREDEPRNLQQYRSPTQHLNMTLKVLSCAPRAFEITNFLSQTEVDHILMLTTGMNLSRSTTAGGVAGDDSKHDDTRNTRTSLNTWVYRERSPIIDAIYRRAADLLRIDEALLRSRSSDEHPNIGTKRSISEALQLVNYEIGQEYTAHHDFGYPDPKNEDQPARFSTLLLYLNEGMEGGETQFPRWQNAETGAGLSVIPEMGKAVLFYSQLPDGNMDDWSHHAAMPVRKGKKWLMNLWVWDPVYEH